MQGCFCQCPIWSIRVDGTSAARKFGDLNRSQRCPPGHLKASERHNARGIGSAVVGVIVKKQSTHCEVGYYEVSSTIGPPHHARQGVTSATISGKKTYKRVTMSRRGRGGQPRLASPRKVNIVPESLSTSRRGSGRWRSPSASGLSMLQFEESADSGNCGRRKKIGRRQREVFI